MTTTPSPSQNKRRGSKKKALYDLDHHPFLFPKEGNLSEEGLVDLLPELQGLGRLGKGQPEGTAQLHGDGQRWPVCPLQLEHQTDPPPLPFAEEEESF